MVSLVISVCESRRQQSLAANLGDWGMTIQRARLQKLGWDDELIIESIDEPGDPSGNQISVEIEACGVCYRDLIDRDGRFPFIRIPITPGHETVGKVCAVGPKVTDWKPVTDPALLALPRRPVPRHARPIPIVILRGSVGYPDASLFRARAADLGTVVPPEPPPLGP